MARTTTTPHKVSRNKSGSPIVRASKLFPGRPRRTTREAVFETGQQARIFADALNLAAVRDGDWRAGFALFASDERRIEYLRTPYDLPKTQEKMRQANLPAPLARRLGLGR